jgi:hypothetical protein
MNELFTRPRMMRTARYAAYGLGAIVALVAAAALILPEVLDLPAVERELQSKLSQVAQGQVAWEKLSIRLLPLPRGSLSEVRVEIPGVASVRAEQLDAHLRLLPLLRGRAEIASLSLSKPAIRVHVPPPQAAREESREEAPSDPVESYRAVVAAIRGLAPEAVLDVEEGDVEVGLPDMPPIRVRRLALHGRTDSQGMELELTAASDAWSRLKVTTTVDFGDGSGAAKVEVAGLKAQPWLDRLLAKSPVGIALPDASLRAEARTDGKTRIECDFGLKAGSVEILQGAGRVQIPGVEARGRVDANKEEITLRLSGAQLGASKLGAGSLRYALKGGRLAGVADFDLDLAQVMSAAGRLVPEGAGKALARFAVSGGAQGQVKFEVQRSGWSTLVDIRKSDSSVAMEGLPGPVRLAGAAVGVTRDAVKIDRAEVAMLDARAIASATIGYGKDVRIEGAVSEGSVGEALLAWVWKTAGAPPHVTLKTPIRVEVQRAAWSPKQPLDIKATASFDAGPNVAAELGWTPGLLEIRRAAIKDTRSDATLALRVKKDFLEGRFSGSLQSTSIGAMLKNANVPSGGANGDLRFRVDLDHPERFSVAGKLGGGSMDLSWLLGRPVAIDKVDLQADGEKLRIREATVNWAGQHVTLRGELARAADGAPIVDAQLESPGVLVDALLQPSGEKQAPVGQTGPADEMVWTQWPLPVRGRITLRTDFIQYGKRKAAPVAAVLVLEEQRASLALQQVTLCGISLPLTVEATPAGLAIAASVTAQKQQLEQTARCLTEEGVLISGDFDLRADLRTQGRLRQLLPNLEGKVSAELRDGKVMKFALLGNILSVKGVSDMLKEGAPKADSSGFPYRSLSAVGRFAKGRFIINESAFDSSAVGLAATGWVSLVDYSSKLTVLVAPFSRVDRLARDVPILGYVFGGALTSLPVGVSGDIRDPRVVPLGPSAVTSELVGIFERTLKLPGRLLPQGHDDPPGPSSTP